MAHNIENILTSAMDQGFGTPWVQQSMISGPEFSKKNIWEVSQVFFGEKIALMKSSKISFSDGRRRNSQTILECFVEIWALLKSFKNPFPMVRAKTKSQNCLKFFFFEKCPPSRKSWKQTTFRAFLATKGPRDTPWVQERQILFRIALTRALSVRLNPTLVFSKMRFQFWPPPVPPKTTPTNQLPRGRRSPTGRKKENPNWSYLYSILSQTGLI